MTNAADNLRPPPTVMQRASDVGPASDDMMPRSTPRLTPQATSSLLALRDTIDDDVEASAAPDSTPDAALDSPGGAMLPSTLPATPASDAPLGFDASMSIDTRKSSAAAPPHDGHVCPFCAYVRDAHASGACPKCTMDDTPGTRRSTGERIGPWFVLQRKNPTAPGLRFSVLLTLARRGHVTPKSIIRGPTTQQLWKYASDVKGLSRLFGTCWHCRRSVSPDAATCPHCRSAQEIPDDPDTFLESYAMMPVMREVAPAVAEDVPQLSAKPQAALPAVASSPADAFDAPGDASRVLAGPRRPASRAIVATGREAGTAIMSASELAAVFQLQATLPPLAARKRGRVGRVLRHGTALLLILGAAGAVTAQVKPEWWQLVRERAEPHVAEVATAWASLRRSIGWGAATTDLPGATPLATEPLPLPSTAVASTPAWSGGDMPADASSTTAREPSNRWTVSSRGGTAGGRTPTSPTSIVGIDPAHAAATPNILNLKTEIDALAGQASIFLPTTRPNVTQRPTAPAQTPSSAVPTDVHSSADAGLPEKRETSARERERPAPPPSVVNGPPKELTIEQATTQADELRKSALDAEARRDWRAAIIIWEQIATLPEAARPSDLKVRLQLAKDRLAS